MADIDVVKKGSRAWLWITLIVLAIIIIWFMMARSGTNPQTGALLQDGGLPLGAAALSSAAAA
jgi:hypothetical protein